MVARFVTFAEDRRQTPAQLALAWVLAKQPRFTPLVGARTMNQLADLLVALERPLSLDEISQIEAMFPPDTISGDRYPAAMMAQLDSES